MAGKKRSIRLPIFMIILVELIGCLIASIICCGCASQARQVPQPQMDSNHYVAQVQQPQGYSCPKRGCLIPEDKINPNIRIENTCPRCGAVFFGKPGVKKTQGQGIVYSGLKSYGPWSVNESDTNYQYFWVGGESFKETETGYSFLSWGFGDRKVKRSSVRSHWTNKRYRLTRRWP